VRDRLLLLFGATEQIALPLHGIGMTRSEKSLKYTMSKML
jgi:hypothetical protein